MNILKGYKLLYISDKIMLSICVLSVYLFILLIHSFHINHFIKLSTLFIYLQGCSKGFHNPEKPKLPEKKVEKPLDADEVY